MDDDYSDYYPTKPKYRLASGDAESEVEVPGPDKTFVAVCTGVGVALTASALLTSGFLQFVLLWIAVALFAGPHAPAAITGGDCRIGLGEVLPPQEEKSDPVEGSGVVKGKGQGKRAGNSSSKSGVTEAAKIIKESTSSTVADVSNIVTEAPGWSTDDLERLQKAMLKYPKGTARRWEAVAHYMGGRKALEDVAAMGKEIEKKKQLAGEGTGGNDPYAKFLAQRKGGAAQAIVSPLTQRWESDDSVQENVGKAEDQGSVVDWSEEKDKALLKALKEFPKDTPARWDKIASAIPGKSKQQCFKRFASLREAFRNSKNGDEVPGEAEETID